MAQAINIDFFGSFASGKSTVAKELTGLFLARGFNVISDHSHDFHEGMNSRGILRTVALHPVASCLITLAHYADGNCNFKPGRCSTLYRCYPQDPYDILITESFLHELFSHDDFSHERLRRYFKFLPGGENVWRIFIFIDCDPSIAKSRYFAREGSFQRIKDIASHKTNEREKFERIKNNMEHLFRHLESEKSISGNIINVLRYDSSTQSARNIASSILSDIGVGANPVL